MIEACLAGVSVRAPGLDGWAQARAVLAGERPYQPAPPDLPPPGLLPPNERRRAGTAVRLALAVASEAQLASGLAPDALGVIFGTSAGDPATIGAILQALARPGGEVSPTQFHNSVHNAAAGYWSIATGSQRPATSLGAHDFTLAASLLTACAELARTGEPVLACIYDTELPAPLSASRRLEPLFGVGFVLVAAASPGLPRLALDYAAAPARPERCLPEGEALRALARGNPAAQALRLLQGLARGSDDAIDLPLFDGRLEIGLRA